MKKSLTEKEIISALTHCKNEDCLKCFLYGEPKCITLLAKSSLNLINKLKKEQNK